LAKIKASGIQLSGTQKVGTSRFLVYFGAVLAFFRKQIGYPYVSDIPVAAGKYSRSQRWSYRAPSGISDPDHRRGDSSQGLSATLRNPLTLLA